MVYYKTGSKRALYCNSYRLEDKNNVPFVLATIDSILHKLHFIDRSSGNTIQGPVVQIHDEDTYLVQSLTEEAITSSQLEGASTTRKVAKEMLRTKRNPETLVKR